MLTVEKSSQTLVFFVIDNFVKSLLQNLGLKHYFQPMFGQQLKTYYEGLLSDGVDYYYATSLQQANAVFEFFKQHWLFIWADAHNDCEDRANAISILLDQWNIPNYKAWVFSGAYLKQEQGTLYNQWNYHVAVVIPVYVDNYLCFYAIDPATLSFAETVDYWANNVTDQAYSYYLIKNSSYYIFNAEMILKDNWYMRDNENYNWTIEGLAGINGVSPDGEMMVNQYRKLIDKTKVEFNKLKNGQPPF